MEGFRPVLGRNEFLANRKARGYATKQSGGTTMIQNDIFINQILITRGPDLPPTVLVVWFNRKDRDTLYHSARAFPTEEALRGWCQSWQVRLSSHKHAL